MAKAHSGRTVGIHDKVTQFGLDHPLVTFVGYVIAVGITWVFVLSNGISHAYAHFKPKPVLTEVEVYMLDVLGGIALTLLLTTLAARNTVHAMGLLHKKYILEAVDQVREEVHSEVGKYFPSVQKVLNDSEGYKACLLTIEAVASEFSARSGPEKIIVSGLSNGYRRRFREAAESLPIDGLFMDVNERRELTRALFEDANSYVVIMRGPYDINNGGLRWHREYLDFVRSAGGKKGAKASWVYLLDAPLESYKIGEIKLSTTRDALAHVAQLDVPVYVVDNFQTSTAVLSGDDRRYFDDLGHLIEVFSGGFSQSLGKKRMEDDTVLAWKATGFRHRSGRLISPKNAKALTTEEAMLTAGSTSVWESEEVAKLIKASGKQAGEDPISNVLNYICENASKVKAP